MVFVGSFALLGCVAPIDKAATLNPSNGGNGGGNVGGNDGGDVGPFCPSTGATLRGTVLAPTPARFGAPDPLYNALVYVPSAPLAPFTSGVTCERCGKVTGAPIVTALSGPDGKFTLNNVPPGKNVPLVIQIGRWRRRVVIPEVAACAESVLPAELTRLPRNRFEGDIPAIAIATGLWDPFDCTLRKIGIDDSEFTLPTGPGRVHMWAYTGNHLGPATPPGTDLVGSPQTLSKYDIVILPCGGTRPKERAGQQNLLAYTNSGGRLFLTDWSNTWLLDGNPAGFEGTVKWKADDIYQGRSFIGSVDDGFPKGLSFSQWLSSIGAASPIPGQIPIHDPFGGRSVVDDVVPPTQRWIYTDGTTTGKVAAIHHFTFNTPIGADDSAQCGRVVFSQFHTPGDEKHALFPTGCDDNPLIPQEKALEFMLFDASSCIQSDLIPPVVY